MQNVCFKNDLFFRRITSPGSASSNFKSFTSLNFQYFLSFNKLFLTELLVNDDESKVSCNQSS